MINMKPSVYLAGGMKSNWQHILIERFGDKFFFFNPQDHLLGNPKEYTIWDLHFVKRADVIFVYVEPDNPSGYGLTLEIGYAKALGKTIILVDERSKYDAQFRKYFKIVRESSNVVFDDLESGLSFLERFSIYSV